MHLGPWLAAAVVVLVVIAGVVAVITLRDPVIAPEPARTVPGIPSQGGLDIEAASSGGRLMKR